MADTEQRIFKIEVDRAAGSLERILGVTRRRGFDISRLQVVADGPCYQVRIETGGSAAEATLALAQLSALVDVKHAVMEEV